VTGYPVHPDALLDRVDLLKCELDHLRTANADLLAALEAVAEDIGDPDSDSWINKPVKLQVLRAIQGAKS
jgi:hypothetical protein